MEQFNYLFLLARVILGFYFIFNGITHFTKLKMLANYAQSKKVPLPGFSVVLTGILLLIGGFSILLGFYVEIGVLALTFFFLPVTFMMHNFWAIQDPQAKMMETISFMKNLALWAAILLFLFIPQPWPYSFNLFR
ncbi:MAG: DoxX family protein [Patescibacteria group bacterium]|nr:DoxX family protein [Patescibacteria group bacterium]